MTNNEQLESIARDLNTCDLMMAIGDKKSARKAANHRKACFSRIREINKQEGFSEISAEELFAELTA